MTSMKAVRIFEFGGPEKLIYGDYPMPEVGPDDVLVKVMATTVSRFDVKYRLGEIHQWGRAMSRHGGLTGRKPFPMPMQLGRDVSGEVAAVGKDVTLFRPGDRSSGLSTLKTRTPSKRSEVSGTYQRASICRGILCSAATPNMCRARISTGNRSPIASPMTI